MSVSDPRITVVPVHKLAPKSGGKPLKHGKFQFMQQMLHGADDKPGYFLDLECWPNQSSML